jgi:Bacitracin resistance protein BacA
LWVVVVVALVGWSAVMWIAERVGKRDRPESSLNLNDAVIIGLVQCVALIPGVARSVATISARLLRDLDRVAATRLAFFLAIPALVAAGAYEVIKEASVISTGSVVCPLDRCCTYGCRRYTDTPARRSWTIPAAVAATTRGGPSRVLHERPPWWLSSERTSGQFYGRSC